MEPDEIVPKRRSGPPLRIDEARERIMDAIRRGATYTHAAMYGGITYKTFCVWRRYGLIPSENDPENRYQIYRDFVAELEQAEAEAVVGWLTTIDEAAENGQWYAHAWKLERRYPHIYGKTAQELTVKQQTKTTIRVVYGDEAEEKDDEQLPNPDDEPLPALDEVVEHHLLGSGSEEDDD